MRYVSHTGTCAIWLIHEHCHCAQNNTLGHYVSFVCARVWYDSFTCVTWIIPMWDMTHSHVRHNSLVRVFHTGQHPGPSLTSLYVHMCDMTHSCVWHDLFIHVTSLIPMCVVCRTTPWARVHVRPPKMVYALIMVYLLQIVIAINLWCIPLNTHMNESPHTYELCMPSEWSMGWLRLVGSLKWYFSFAEYSLFYRALLQKRPIILRSLRIVATPYLLQMVYRPQFVVHPPKHTYEWVTAHIWRSHGTHMNESRHTYEWVMAHIWMSHGTHTTESCLTLEGPPPKTGLLPREGALILKWFEQNPRDIHLPRTKSFSTFAQ